MGLQLAPLTGRLFAQIATGQPPDHDITPLRPDRFNLRARGNRQSHPAHVAQPGLGDEAVTGEPLAAR